MFTLQRATKRASRAAKSHGTGDPGLQFAYSHGGDNTIGVSSRLGGLANFSGYLADEIVSDQLGLARAIYYRRLNKDSLVMGLPLYAGGSVEIGGFWNAPEDIDSDELITAGSVFLGIDTFLGPIFLGYGRAETGVDSFTCASARCCGPS